MVIKNVFHRIYHSMRNPSYLIFFIIVICSVLPDLDHLFKGCSREIHFPLVVISFGIFIFFTTLYSRRIKNRILKGLGFFKEP